MVVVVLSPFLCGPRFLDIKISNSFEARINVLPPRVAKVTY